MLRAIYKLIFYNLLGWRIEGNFDLNIKKYIVIVAPHTSNWDFIIGVMARSILGIKDAKFLGKSQLFKWPYGFIFRALGGYPVDRSRHNNLVEAAVAIFNSKERFAMALAPEGTRKKVDKLKTGFYHIAVQAKIPIYMVGFDYVKKTIFIRHPFYPTGNVEEDMRVIVDYFSTIQAKHPEKAI